MGPPCYSIGSMLQLRFAHPVTSYSITLVHQRTSSFPRTILFAIIDSTMPLKLLSFDAIGLSVPQLES